MQFDSSCWKDFPFSFVLSHEYCSYDDVLLGFVTCLKFLVPSLIKSYECLMQRNMVVLMTILGRWIKRVKKVNYFGMNVGGNWRTTLSLSLYLSIYIYCADVILQGWQCDRFGMGWPYPWTYPVLQLAWPLTVLRFVMPNLSCYESVPGQVWY